MSATVAYLAGSMYTVTAGLSTAAVLILALITRAIARDGGHDVHRGADEAYAEQLHELADMQRMDWAVTAEMPAIAAEVAAELAPPPHRGRHYEDTVEIVTGDYMPLVNPRFAEFLASRGGAS